MKKTITALLAFGMSASYGAEVISMQRALIARGNTCKQANTYLKKRIQALKTAYSVSEFEKIELMECVENQLPGNPWETIKEQSATLTYFVDTVEGNY